MTPSSTAVHIVSLPSEVSVVEDNENKDKSETDNNLSTPLKDIIKPPPEFEEIPLIDSNKTVTENNNIALIKNAEIVVSKDYIEESLEQREKSDRLSEDEVEVEMEDESEISNRSDDIKVEFKNKEGKSIIPVLSRNNSGEKAISNSNSSIGGGTSVSVTSSTPTKLLNTSNNNKSMITINSGNVEPMLGDISNSLASNVSQITVVTSTHPPVIIDNSIRVESPVITSLPKSSSSEVVIVSNELNKTHVNESSTDDDYPSLDSLECSPRLNSNAVGKQSNTILINEQPPRKHHHHNQKQQQARKLDESEVLIVSSSFVDDDSAYTTSGSTTGTSGGGSGGRDSHLLDTSHVSVVTVGEEEIHVKDSSHITAASTTTRAESSSDLSSVGGPSESGDDLRIDQILIKNRLNGQLNTSSKTTTLETKDDVNIIVNRKKTKPEKQHRISPDSSVGSMDGSRTHSECGSVRSSGGTPIGVVKIDRSDAESIATTASHDSNRDPEEEVIIRRTKQAPSAVTSASEKAAAAAERREEIQLRNLRKKTRKRTRKFEIDGVQVTTTTSKVIYGDEENGKLYDDHIFRKQELRELKMLQKQEKKQQTDLQIKEQIARDQQDRRFEQERIALEKTYEADMDTLARQQKQLIEKTEQQQEAELRASSKRIRAEQEQELKLFRDNLKQEIRLLKQEIDLLPKDKRKDEFKKRRAAMEQDHEEKERLFLDSLKERHELLLRRISEKHRDRLATIDRNFLQQKQTAMRTREAMLWELEEKHLHERHQLAKRHVKDMCFMQRHQMIIRHEKELEQVKRMLQRKEEELVKRQAIERKNLPKRIRNERKVRDMMFRESLRISTNLDPEAEREKLKKVRIV